jgi:hypothetical protein
MTEEEFFKRSYRAFMPIDYHNPRMKNVDGGEGVIIPCLLIEVNFDNHQFKLQVIGSFNHEQTDFYCSIKNCEFLARKLKVSK